MAANETGELLPADVRATLEAEHGPVVAISHPDGSCFAFKRMTRAEFEIRRKRVDRKDAEADERLLQERCVWPSRQAWNEYVAASVFETLAYTQAYRSAHGGGTARLSDAEEIGEDYVGHADVFVTLGERVFAFRKPQRAEVKRFKSEVLSSKKDALEQLLRSCSVVSDASPGDFAAWLDSNLFAVDALGDVLVGAWGMGEASIAVK